ncbi:MAG TPA: COX15/CtaA family protein [Bryobacteraceae bacterium]|nr:COX15/CtaA family protein [Bryobacteraceae bacterium]
MELQGDKSRTRFQWFAWALLAYNLPVILWGAYVRVSFSGDGCGAHWPFCNGQALPAKMATPTLIEFTHRMMTSVDSIGTIVLCVWAFLAFAKPHPVRRYASLSLVFLLIEALLGAGLVIFRYVAKDQSAGRVWYLSAHLTNTMLLLATLAATAWLASASDARIRIKDASRRMLGAVFVTVAVSVTGAIAALGDTLFPSSSMAEGMRQDFSSASSMLLRLRLLHPVAAVLGAAYLIWVAAGVLRGSQEGSPVRRAAARVTGIVVFQIAAGAINISLLAPMWMQMIHLLVADLVWIAVVLLLLETVRAEGMPRDSGSLTDALMEKRAAWTAHD